jgi:predicted transposase YbfD/YdcC
LLGELEIAHCIITLDAMHCQKKPSRPPHRRRLAPSFN